MVDIKKVAALELLLEQAKRGTDKPLYVCLRNCYVGEQLWKKEKTYDLPESLDKSPANFRMLGVTEEEAGAEILQKYEEEMREEAKVAKSPPDEEEEEPRDLAEGYFFCTKCRTTHRTIPNKSGKMSSIARRHLKYKAE